MFSSSFKNLIKTLSPKTYIGRGNPNAKILFVGKEYSKPNEKNEFIVFSKGLRGGKDYEKDTYRVAPINNK